MSFGEVKLSFRRSYWLGICCLCVRAAVFPFLSLFCFHSLRFQPSLLRQNKWNIIGEGKSFKCFASLGVAAAAAAVSY